MNIVVIVAMEEEMTPLRKRANAQKVDQLKHLNIYEAINPDYHLYLVESGIGKANAAMGATIAIERFKPDYVLNYGVVGSIKDYIHAGDIVIPNDFTYHDADDTAFGSPLGRVARMPATYPIAAQLQPIVNTLLSKHNFFHTGQCLTSDAFMYQAERINFVRNAFPEGIIVEMEATAIAQVSYTYNLPFLSIKSVSDTSSEQAPEEYLKDKDQVAINAADVLFKAIDLLQQN